MLSAPPCPRQTGPSIGRGTDSVRAPATVMRCPARALSICSRVGCVISPPVIAPTMVTVRPRRRAHPSARSEKCWRHKATASAMAATVWTTIARPMMVNRTPSTSVPTLKWLVVPRHACTSMMTISSSSVIVVTPAHHAACASPVGKVHEDPRKGQRVDSDRRRKLGRLRPLGHTTNLPPGSSSRATPVAASSAIIATPVAVSLASDFHSAVSDVLMFMAASFQGKAGFIFATGNINIHAHVDIVNMCAYDADDAQKTPGSNTASGNLSRSLLQEALRTIEKGGVAALTLRSVGEKLGVSRTALYRHFADKSALLAAVATEGFRTLRQETQYAWDSQGADARGSRRWDRPTCGLPWPTHSAYRVMFGGYVRSAAPDSDLATEGAGAFQVLVDAIVSQQQDGLVRADNPLALAQYIWANVHGVAMLAMNGSARLKQPIDDVIRFANERMRTGIESTGPRLKKRKSKV